MQAEPDPIGSGGRFARHGCACPSAGSWQPLERDSKPILFVVFKQEVSVGTLFSSAGHPPVDTQDLAR